MPDSINEILDAIAKVLFRCWILGFALLFIWLAAVLLLGETIHTLHGPMFGLSDHELNVIFYCGMGFLKLNVLTFFFLPWCAIKSVARKSRSRRDI